MKSTEISEVMIRDHGKIVDLLIDFEKSIGQDIHTIMKAFDKFEWNLEKHIFVEERAIFIAYEPEDEVEGYSMIPELMKEHNEILNKLKKMKKNIKKHKTFNFLEFKEILTNHKNFEDEKVYPKFDQELDVPIKKAIIKRINEIELSDSGLVI